MDNQQYANDTAPREDIIFVTGYVKAAQWAITVFNDTGSEHGFSFSAPGGNVASSSFEFRTATQTTVIPHQRSGPVRSGASAHSNRAPEGDAPRDQCLFLRYYKIRYSHGQPTGIVVGEPSHGSSPSRWQHASRSCVLYCSAVCSALGWPCRQCDSDPCGGGCGGHRPAEDAASTDVAMPAHEVPSTSDTQVRSVTSDHSRR